MMLLEKEKIIYLNIINKIVGLQKPGESDIQRILRNNPLSNKNIARKSFVLRAYKELKEELNLKKTDEKKFLLAIQMKQTRTISGVTPVTVLTKPYPCPGNCIFCPSESNMPKSYLYSEPGAQRAYANKFDPYLQTYNRLVAFYSIGHPTDKIELIILGGSWSAYPKSYQIWFIKRCFDALNAFNPKNLIETLPPDSIDVSNTKGKEKCNWDELFKAQKVNEKAKTRCIGLVVETRPELITKDEVIRLRKLGCTKVQIGIQSLDNNVLKKNKRGHSVKDTAHAFKILRSFGFKIHGHYMPNLYGSNANDDIKDYKKLFSDKRFKPDELKIYPCSLLFGTKLMELYKKGKWIPYSEKDLTKVLTNMFKVTPRYCRITRVIRDIPSNNIIVGNKKTNFRQIVEENLKKEGFKLQDIRSREIRDRKIDINDLTLKIAEYATSVSKEIFLEYVSKNDEIAGFLRLSLPNSKLIKKNTVMELKNSAIIREIHVYGQSIEVGKKEKGLAQHIGLGKKLIKEAIKISSVKGFKKLCVISSVGTREYYRKNGFSDGKLYQYIKL